MPPPKDPIKYEMWLSKQRGVVRTEGWLQKQRESHLGQIPWNKGKKGIYSEESLKKMREIKRERGSLSPEHCRAISKGRKGMRFSELHKERISKTLQSVYPKGENHHCWKGGTSFIPYCYKFNNRRKQAVRSFFGFRCIACGISQDENLIAVKRGMKPVKLAVHHIDHDKEQGCNGKPFNLVAFCNSCHSLEGQHEEEYRLYVNRVLQDGFDWGIWSERDYLVDVMYDE